MDRGVWTGRRIPVTFALMDPAIAAIAAAATLFVALGTLILGLFAWLRADMRRMEERLRADMAGLERRTEERFERLEAQVDARFAQVDAQFVQVDARFAQVDARFERLEARMAAMEHGQAKLEGLLEGLREAIAGRARQAAE